MHTQMKSLLSTFDNNTYKINSLGQIIMSDLLMNNAINKRSHIDNMDDLLWNAACTNHTC